MTTYHILLLGVLAAVAVIGGLGLVQWWRTPRAAADPDRPAVAAVFTAAAIEEAASDRVIRRARFRYGLTAGAAIGGVLAYTGYLFVVDDGDRGGPVYYAGFAGQLVMLASLYAIGFVTYPLVARARLRKVLRLRAAGTAELDDRALRWLAGQRRLLAIDGWLGAVAAASAVPVLGYIIVSVFVRHGDPAAALPKVVIVAGIVAFLPVLLDSATVARRIPWNDWVFEGSATSPPSRVARPMYQGILVGLLTTLAVLAAVGAIAGSGDPIHAGPAHPVPFSPPPHIEYTPPKVTIPSIPVFPTFATIAPIPSAT